MEDNFSYKDIMLPSDIEKKSFEIITKELGNRTFDPEFDPVIKRVIHTTADFDYADNLVFSEHAVRKMQEAIKNGAGIVTDTNMAKAGINKKKLAEYGGEVYCFMADPDVAEEAKERKITRAAVSMLKAASLGKNLIFVCGNAPTALMKIYELLQENLLLTSNQEKLADNRLEHEHDTSNENNEYHEYIKPYISLENIEYHKQQDDGISLSTIDGIIAVPVGFVHVVEAKELILKTAVPHIVARGRKGGSNVAAAIVNAILYSM